MQSLFGYCKAYTLSEMRMMPGNYKAEEEEEWEEEEEEESEEEEW